MAPALTIGLNGRFEASSSTIALNASPVGSTPTFDSTCSRPWSSSARPKTNGLEIDWMREELLCSRRPRTTWPSTVTMVMPNQFGVGLGQLGDVVGHLAFIDGRVTGRAIRCSTSRSGAAADFILPMQEVEFVGAWTMVGHGSGFRSRSRSTASSDEARLRVRFELTMRSATCLSSRSEGGRDSGCTKMPPLASADHFGSSAAASPRPRPGRAASTCSRSRSRSMPGGTLLISDRTSRALRAGGPARRSPPCPENPGCRAASISSSRSEMAIDSSVSSFTPGCVSMNR